ncbi:hypothetical protein GWI33_005967 [Rhynchophorus ferrugineus]|uniref:Uncharacterized protein n=1 Tax=Rhynchophorus ferrugineus TaxID=354439 RepID=A0A834IWC5_RHYFE|nr:hypothetical protein GWI33_005967 [Rhynchophorus ferrugineus]
MPRARVHLSRFNSKSSALDYTQIKRKRPFLSIGVDKRHRRKVRRISSWRSLTWRMDFINSISFKIIKEKPHFIFSAHHSNKTKNIRISIGSANRRARRKSSCGRLMTHSFDENGRKLKVPKRRVEKELATGGLENIDATSSGPKTSQRKVRAVLRATMERHFPD